MEEVQVTAPTYDCSNVTDIDVASNISSVTLPIQVTGSNNMSQSLSTLGELVDTSVMDQDAKQKLAANAHNESPSDTSIPKVPSKTFERSSRKRKKRKAASELLRLGKDALKKIRKRTLASRHVSNLNPKKPIMTGDKSETHSSNVDEEELNFNHCDPESPLERCTVEEMEVDGIEMNTVPLIKGLITAGEQDRVGIPETMDESTAENTVLDINVQGTETTLIVSVPTQCPSASPSRNLGDEVELDQVTIANSKNVKTETTPNDCSEQEVVSSIECTASTSTNVVDEVLSFLDFPAPMTHDATAEPGTELEESVPPIITEAESTEESSVSRLPTVHRCVKCMETFSDLEKLLRHQWSHGKETYSDHASSGNQSKASSPGAENSPAGDDIAEDHENLISTIGSPFLKPGDILPNDSESDDSETEYYNDDNEISDVKEEINIAEDGKNADLQPSQLTSTLNPEIVSSIAFTASSKFEEVLGVPDLTEVNTHGVTEPETALEDSDYSEPEFYDNEEEINVDTHVEELEQQSLQLTSTLEPNSETGTVDNRKDNNVQANSENRSNNDTNQCNAIELNQTEVNELMSPEGEPESPTGFINRPNVNSIPLIDSVSDIEREPTEPINTYRRITRSRTLVTKESSTSTLRAVHRCSKSKKTFSSSETLLKHQRSHEKKKSKSDSDSKSEDDSPFEVEDSESDFRCSDDEDEEEDDSDTEDDDSESDNSETAYHSENEINAVKVKKEFSVEEDGKNVDVQPSQPNLEVVSAIECTSTASSASINFEEEGGLSVSDVTAANTRDVAPTSEPEMKLKESAPTVTEAEKATGSSRSRLREVHRCAKCKKTFSDPGRLLEHQRSHETEAHSKSILDKDSSSDEGNSESDYSSDEEDGSDRRKSTITKKGTKCKICKLPLANASAFYVRKHYNAQHNRKNLKGSDVKKCVQAGCGAYFLNYYQLRLHEKFVHAIYRRNTCTDCNRTFSHYSGLRTHYRIKHANELNYVCTFKNCDKRYKTDQQLEGHITAMHEQKRQLHKCPTCEKKFWGESDFQKHLQSHPTVGMPPTAIKKPLRPFQCKIADCAKKLRNKKQYNNHKKLHRKFTCFFCDVTKDYALELARHEIKEHSPTAVKLESSDNKGLKNESIIFKCPRPKCSFRSSKEHECIHHFVTVHMKLRLPAKKKKTCNICNLTLSSITALKLHYDTHHNLKNLSGSDVKKCKQTGCPAYFMTYPQLRTHERSIHGIDVRYSCDECNKIFKSRDGLREHFNSQKHKDELNYVCSFENCFKRYKTNDLLEGHMKRIHEEQRQLMNCPTCGKPCWGEFNFQTHLKSHSQVRKVARNFICEQCGKAFSGSEKLEMHYLSHSGPASWEFECSVCSKKCLTQQKLDEHMRTHTKEKPFVCEICGVKYAHRHNLRIHVNSKHKEVTQDKPRKFNKVNMSSRKGIKRKKKVEEESLTESSCESDSDSDD